MIPVPVAPWEPLVLSAALAIGALAQSPRQLSGSRMRSEWWRDIASLALALIIASAIRSLWQPDAGGPLEWPRVTAALVAFDVFLYGLHRFGHGAGWRMHRAHHVPPHFGVGMAFRDSALHLAIYAVAFVGLELAFALDALEAAMVSCVLLVFQVWTHTRIWLSLGPLDWILIGPRHHAVHHHIPMKAQLVNLGGMLCLWDQLFGTYRHPSADDPTPFAWPVRRPPRLRDWLGL